MLVRNVFENDFVEIANKARQWGDIVIERETIYHLLTRHFRGTCFVAEDRPGMIGYLLGFRSQTQPEEAYLHLVQVDPAMRGHGVGRQMFRVFEESVRKMGCKRILAASRPQNKSAMKFYEVVGLKPVQAGTMIEVDGVMAVKDYNGPGKHIVLWAKEL